MYAFAWHNISHNCEVLPENETLVFFHLYICFDHAVYSIANFAKKGNNSFNYSALDLFFYLCLNVVFLGLYPSNPLAFRPLISPVPAALLLFQH